MPWRALAVLYFQSFYVSTYDQEEGRTLKEYQNCYQVCNTHVSSSLFESVHIMIDFLVYSLTICSFDLNLYQFTCC